ncbi:hypothetical protein E2C01_056586 [Portunus trituberculatus]|uniref:Uncharacterized protein n=1 Tax=Portunus trituberculatus TaxID=210409 RepID=A0A5B7GQR2_PORTR|nr:hypothetical protein [Portunus trituberculatus]
MESTETRRKGRQSITIYLFIFVGREQGGYQIYCISKTVVAVLCADARGKSKPRKRSLREFYCRQDKRGDILDSFSHKGREDTASSPTAYGNKLASSSRTPILKSSLKT